MSDPTETEVPAEGATPAADPPEADGLAAEMAQMRERLASYEAADAKRQREQADADAKLLEEQDALTRSHAERDALKAQLEARDGALDKLAKSQMKQLALKPGMKALLKGKSPAEVIDWIAEHGASYRRDAAPATRQGAGQQVDYGQMDAAQLSAAMTAEARKHKCRPSELRQHNPDLYRHYVAQMN